MEGNFDNYSFIATREQEIQQIFYLSKSFRDFKFSWEGGKKGEAGYY